jgi:hypothetical protein
MIEFSKGMLYLSSSNIIHRYFLSILFFEVNIPNRDLACRNLLVLKVNNSYSVKVADFGKVEIQPSINDQSCFAGLSKQNEYKISSGRVPIRWSAVEVLMQGTATTKVRVLLSFILFSDEFARSLMSGRGPLLFGKFSVVRDS